MLEDIVIKTFHHLELTFISLFIAMALAVPLGIRLARIRSKKLAEIILRFIAILQTVPGLALMALIIVLLSVIRPILPLPTTGVLPSTIILTVYAFIPICSSTYTGLKQVSHSMIEIADGMGMTQRQKLFWVEIPLALPVVMAGIRMALVWTIGLVTLTSLVGSGGLGDLILQGLRTMQPKLVLAGTLPAAALAVLCDWLLDKAATWIVPQKLCKN